MRERVRRQARHTPPLVASAVLVAWGCAQPAEVDRDTPSYEPNAGSSGTSGGSLSPSGGSSGKSTGGSSGQSSGGSATVSGGTSGSAGSGTAGSNTSGGNGGSASGAGGSTGGGGSAGTSAGTDATGGVGGSAGAGATGGVSGAGAAGGTTGGSGGDVSAGGATGGGGSAGSSGAGGSGGSGGMLDPNWMPPADMADKAKVVLLYHCDQTANSSTNIAASMTLRNQTDEPYDMSQVTIRYWMSSEPPPRPELYHSSSNLSATTPPVFVANNANSYLRFSFRAGGTLPVYVDQNTLNSGQVNFGVQRDGGVNSNFNQANDWSFDRTASQSKVNPKITVYDGDTLIWGCEPSQVCADTEDSGAAGAAAE
ncbi:MAG TPA: cellulose binding domain-containing protein [Polyangiaceae bacterium]